MKLIPDWRQIHKLYSVQLNFVGFVFTAAAAALGAGGWSWLAAAIFVLAIMGRVVSQSDDCDDNSEHA
jgi:hypothetical protein